MVQCTDTAVDRYHGGTGRQQCRCIVPKAVYTVKKCSWGWKNLSPETCRADLKTLIKRLINEKVVASCWLLTQEQFTDAPLYVTLSFEGFTASVVQIVVLWVHTPCSIMCSDVSEKCPTSIFRVTKFGYGEYLSDWKEEIC